MQDLDGLAVVKLGREYHPMHREMLSWLHENVGDGGGWRQHWPDNWLWDFSVFFGHADVRFRQREDAFTFMLTWC